MLEPNKDLLVMQDRTMRAKVQMIASSAANLSTEQ
jgi:hypothetical protein